MTLGKLIKSLQELQASVGSRIEVSVDKESLWDGNKTFCICAIEDVKVTWVLDVGGDGETQYTKAGRERGKYRVVLYGEKQISAAEVKP